MILNLFKKGSAVGRMVRTIGTLDIMSKVKISMMIMLKKLLQRCTTDFRK
nr:MAG TPA: hypothetical protein [Caudoviricetes sp.]